jgi:uncharacterized RDD family membrane protein YckC
MTAPDDVPAHVSYLDPNWPKGGTVPGALADWWRRAVAIILDGLILSIPNFIILSILGVEATEIDPTTDQVMIVWGEFVVATLVGLVNAVVYSGLLDGSSHGQTVGKMAMRIQVRDAHRGGPIGFGRAAARRFVYQMLFLALVVPGAINALSPLWDRHRQAWHDKALQTVVVNSG